MENSKGKHAFKLMCVKVEIPRHHILFHCPPFTGTIWMNWCMVGICAGCIPLLLLFKEKYSRLELDAANRQAKQSGIQVVVQDEETPLITSVDRSYGGENSSLKNRTNSATSEV